MPVFDIAGQRVLFVHIPKTAGSSLTQWLSGHGHVSFFRPRPEPPLAIPPQHLRWRDFDYLLNAPTFDYAFAVVRDPYTRFESSYYWSHRHHDKNGDPWDDFNSWATRQIKQARANPFHSSNHFCPQVSFLADPVEVLRLEDGMDTITTHIATKLGIAPPAKQPHHRARPSKGAPVTWSSDAVALVRTQYAEDFAQLGYDPDRIRIMQ